MENPYNGNYYQPYTPTPQQTPVPPVYDGNQTMASLSLVMGILALLSLCCMPFLLFIFAGLAILFSCLSKGQYARSGPAKAGMAIGISCITLAIGTDYYHLYSVSCNRPGSQFHAGLFLHHHLRRSHRRGAL